MRRAIRQIAYWLNWSTSYHVAAQYTRDSHVGFSVISLTVQMRPWLHRENYDALMNYVHSECVKPSSMPSITSVTKLGI